jgi:plastocyanin domain-containing protein
MGKDKHKAKNDNQIDLMNDMDDAAQEDLQQTLSDSEQ